MPEEKAKKHYVSEETFAELVESAEQALRYERGAREGYRVTWVALPKPLRPMSSDEIARLRRRLK